MRASSRPLHRAALAGLSAAALLAGGLTALAPVTPAAASGTCPDGGTEITEVAPATPGNIVCEIGISPGSTSWTVPAGVTSVDVVVVGAGGGGGGGGQSTETWAGANGGLSYTPLRAYPGGGGAGGQVVVSTGIAVTPGDAITVDLGVGGAGGASGSGTTASLLGAAGGNGTSTTFGSETAFGGGGGAAYGSAVPSGGFNGGGGAGVGSTDSSTNAAPAGGDLGYAGGDGLAIHWDCTGVSAWAWASYCSYGGPDPAAGTTASASLTAAGGGAGAGGAGQAAWVGAERSDAGLHCDGSTVNANGGDGGAGVTPTGGLFTSSWIRATDDAILGTGGGGAAIGWDACTAVGGAGGLFQYNYGASANTANSTVGDYQIRRGTSAGTYGGGGGGGLSGYFQGFNEWNSVDGSRGSDGLIVVRFEAPAGGAATTSLGVGGSHACATDESGSVTCWGDNRFGQLGNGERGGYSATPVDTGITDAVKVVTGRDHSCVLHSNTTVSCWGRNSYGQLGDRTRTTNATPVSVYRLSDVVDLAAGARHTCAVIDDGGVYCWGLDQRGALGDGSSSGYSTRPQEADIYDAVQITAGQAHTCAVRSDTTVACWGRGTYGRLGDGRQVPAFTPTDVVGLSDVAEVSAGSSFTCARLNDGTAKCWGKNGAGYLGAGSHTGDRTFGSTPVDVVGLTDVVSLDAGDFHACAALADGSVQCWGWNRAGQLGTGAFDGGSNTPVEVDGGPQGFATVQAGGFGTCATRGDGTVACWGRNTSGQLGDGSTQPSASPVAAVLPWN